MPLAARDARDANERRIEDGARREALLGAGCLLVEPPTTSDIAKTIDIEDVVEAVRMREDYKK